MNFTHLDEVQQFRLLLRSYLKQFVVPALKNGENYVLRMDGSVFDRLSVGPHLASSWERCILAIGEYARAILFYEFNVRTYPTRDVRALTVTFFASEPKDALPMPEWDPLPDISGFDT